MARYIESPGVQINEIDLSLNAQLPVGTNVLVNGFTDSGPTQELLNITGIEEYKQIYGIPTNAAERYSYHTMTQLLGTSAKVLFNRLPYGIEGGTGFNDSYTALMYPIYSVYTDASGNQVSGLTSSIAYATSALPSGEVYHLIGKPTQIALTEAEYSDWKAGNIDWANGSIALSGATGLTSSLSAAGNAGIIVVNKLKTSVNQDFEGYYVAMSDNYQSTTTTLSTDNTFDSIRAVYTSKNAVGGATLANNWSSIASSRFDFPLIGSIKQSGSISETIEGVPTWDFGNAAYQDSLIISVYKFRRSGYSPSENALTFIPYEGFVGAIGNDRKYTPPNSFQESTFSLEKIVNDASSYLDVLVNPNLSKLNWVGDDGIPNRKVRVLSTMLSGDLDLGALATADVKADAAFTLGLYQSKTETKKLIGNVAGKLELGLALAEDFEKYPLDIVVDAGLSTIFTASELSNLSGTAASTYEYEYDDVAALKGIFNSDAVSGNEKAGLLDVDGGTSSLARLSWQTIFDKFDGFCRETRKDCFFVADCLRHQLVSGKNQKVLDNKTYNFFQHVYTPFKNLVAGANSSYSAIYAQWAQVYDTNSGSFVWVPFSGFQAAIMARVDANLYPWYAPAGLENGIVRGVADIALTTTQKQRDILYSNNVNCIVFFPNDGIVTWGQKTLQKKPSAFDRINVRRLFLTLEKGTRSIMKYFVFQPNTVFTRTRVLNVLTPIFDVPKNHEGLYDYMIICDNRNNTPNVIDANELVVDVYLKPVRSGEFILVNFYSTRTDQNFSELL